MVVVVVIWVTAGVLTGWRKWCDILNGRMPIRMNIMIGVQQQVKWRQKSKAGICNQEKSSSIFYVPGIHKLFQMPSIAVLALKTPAPPSIQYGIFDWMSTPTPYSIDLESAVRENNSSWFDRDRLVSCQAWNERWYGFRCIGISAHYNTTRVNLFTRAIRILCATGFSTEHENLWTITLMNHLSLFIS